MRKKVKRRWCNSYLRIQPGESMHIEGGRLWPLLDIRDVLNRALFGEDIFFTNLYKIEKQ